MDYKTAMQTAIDAQSSLFGTQIGSVQADIAANEARRIADQQAAAAAAATQRQADQKAAAEQARQANIRTTATQARAGTQDVMRQLESMQKAGMVPQQAQVVEAGPGFDLSDPLNTGFFSGFQAKKEQQTQPQPTKIATGGYIDDLLAEGMSVDDLMNLLR
jgi:murein L,D-transpeptidase YcbB/YkuD